MGFFQYLKDTRGELRHVAWPTQFQTIVYTVIVIFLSLFIALYLGFFDFIFTSGLRNVLEALPPKSAVSPLTVSNVQIASSTPASVTIKSSTTTKSK